MAALDASNALTDGGKESNRNFFDFLGDYPVLKLVAFASFVAYLIHFFGEPDDRNLSASQFDLLVSATVVLFASFFYDASALRTNKPVTKQKVGIMRKL